MKDELRRAEDRKASGITQSRGRNPKVPLFTFPFFSLPCVNQAGFSLIEVMVAMVILAFGILGVMGTFQTAEHGLREGAKSTRALAMVESRLEAKRATPWEALLTEDADGDGAGEIEMLDDGTRNDVRAGDGIYTASLDREGIHLLWTVQPNRVGSLKQAGSVLIQAEASYAGARGQPRTIRLGTLRANPRYVGVQ